MMSASEGEGDVIRGVARIFSINQFQNVDKGEGVKCPKMFWTSLKEAPFRPAGRPRPASVDTGQRRASAFDWEAQNGGDFALWYSSLATLSRTRTCFPSRPPTTHSPDWRRGCCWRIVHRGWDFWSLKSAKPKSVVMNEQPNIRKHNPRKRRTVRLREVTRGLSSGTFSARIANRNASSCTAAVWQQGRAAAATPALQSTWENDDICAGFTTDG